ncbi:MAG TPA: hypothetical protein DCR74_11455 [Achromobacter sp.]|nr:hypothetical protein [Achromobacter sp.]
MLQQPEQHQLQVVAGHLAAAGEAPAIAAEAVCIASAVGATREPVAARAGVTRMVIMMTAAGMAGMRSVGRGVAGAAMMLTMAAMAMGMASASSALDGGDERKGGHECLL